MIELFAFNIEENSDQINTLKLLQYVAADKKEKIAAFRDQADGQRTLLADLLIRAIASRHLKLNNNDVEFRTNEYGKPYIYGIDTFHFNLSHAGKWIVCVTDNEAIGIDIEKIASVEMDIAKTFFSAEEFAYIMGKTEADRIPLFYDFWTLKESYIKALGCGLNKDLNSFAVILKSEANAVIKDSQDQSQVFLRQYLLEEEYRLSVCAFKSEFPDEIQIVDMGWILNGIQKKSNNSL